ncbi:hypothetical protein [Anaerosalibacter sp. Marseille-P3206]|uniref:hypothetical protein n=1 Tax=Anaerosalibacter sp. Marseille-P3206 TaxID=1871005 RepID=UPI00098784D7|nr:hypothetical protein [Anaerosalibacter sp. Marseille-P3206]
MKKFKFKDLKPVFILFVISVIVTVILSLTNRIEGKFIQTLSNNFFVVGTVYMTVGIMFEIIGWSTRKKYLRKPMSKDELEEIKHSHKDAGIVKSMNKEKEAEKRKEIYGMLWKAFVIVGFVDFGLSLIMLLFIK